MKAAEYTLLAILFLFNACSSSNQTAKEDQKKQPEVFVFDDVSKVDTTKIDSSKTKIPESKPSVKETALQKVNEQPIQTTPTATEKFVVQLGAFSSKERAEEFVKENQAKIQQQMVIVFDDKLKLFVVKLPPFPKREDAELIKNNIRQIPAFKDAFIKVEAETK